MSERSSAQVCEIVLHLPNCLDLVWRLIAFDPNSFSMDLYSSKNLFTILLRIPDRGSCAARNPHVRQYILVPVLLFTPLRAARDRS